MARVSLTLDGVLLLIVCSIFSLNPHILSLPTFQQYNENLKQVEVEPYMTYICTAIGRAHGIS